MQKRTGFDADTKTPVYSPFFPEPAGGIEKHPEGNGVLSEILTSLLNNGIIYRFPQQWWREIFIPGQMLPLPLFLSMKFQKSMFRIFFTNCIISFIQVRETAHRRRI